MKLYNCQREHGFCAMTTLKLMTENDLSFEGP
jgi:hypothetical protein